VTVSLAIASERNRQNTDMLSSIHKGWSTETCTYDCIQVNLRDCPNTACDFVATLFVSS